MSHTSACGVEKIFALLEVFIDGGFELFLALLIGPGPILDGVPALFGQPGRLIQQRVGRFFRIRWGKIPAAEVNAR
jgi:hypothetical protein